MKRTLGFALLFTIAYVLVFSSPLKKEPVLKPVWVQNLAKPSEIASQSSGDTIAFRMGRIFGYVTPQGAIKYLNTAQFNVAMNNRHFINFSSVSENLVEKDTAGRITQTIPSSGYPVFKGGRFFVISADRTALSELDSQGTTIWTRDFGSLITSMDDNSTLAVVGLLNGSTTIVDTRGRVVSQFTPSGSKFSIIYGCAISPSGEYVAIVSGLQPQKFILLARDKKGQYQPNRVVDLPTDMRHQVLIHFFGSVPYVYVEAPGAIYYFGTHTGTTGKVAVDGSVEALTGGDSFITALSTTATSATQSELTVFAPAGRVLLRNVFDGHNLFATALGPAVYVGIDNRLMRIDYTIE